MSGETKIKPGCIIEYLHSNEVNIGSVISTEKHLTIITPNNRTIKLSKSRILPWIGPFLGEDISRQELLNIIERLTVHREEIKTNIDTEELWNLIHEEVDECTVFWLSELLWEEPNIDQIAALGRALIADKVHFKLLNQSFKVFPPEVVENKLHQINKEAREKVLIEKGKEFFNSLWKKRQDPKTELPYIEKDLEQDLISLIKKGIAAPENKSFQKKWKKLTEDIPQNPHLPLVMAQTWGILPKHYNYLLDQADYFWGNKWCTKYKDDILRIIDNFHSSKGEVENIPFISIDSASTRDIDDAFYIEESGEKGYVLYLVFASPVLGWQFDSELNKEVSKRASSLYLPEGTSHMLPEELGTDIFSLHAKDTRPALLLRIEITPDTEILSYELKNSWIRVDKNLTYKEVEQYILEKKDKLLINAFNLAQKLRKKRLNNGAVIIERQEPIIILTEQGDDYHIELIQPSPCPNSQLIVSEFMILANSIAARWAYEEDIPLIFRTQDISIPKESSGIWKDPVKIYGIIKLLTATNIETTPKPHVSIGVESYAPITSPLRRYIDFINLSQIDKKLRGERTWTKDELSSMLPYLNFRAQEVSKIQKFRTRYWKLLYLKRYNKKREWHGIAVDEDPQCYTFVMPEEQLLIKVPKNLVRGDIFLGKKFRLWFNKIDPLSNQIKVQKIEEEEWKD